MDPVGLSIQIPDHIGDAMLYIYIYIYELGH